MDGIASPDVSIPLDGNLKPITAFGVNFAGKVSFDDSKIEEIYLWTTDEHISPSEARLVFHRLLESINLRLRDGKLIEDIPNFEDASDVKSDACIWNKENDLIILTIDGYHNRAGISLSRLPQSLWLARMGSDSGEFWQETLKSLGVISGSPSKEIKQPFDQSKKSKIDEINGVLYENDHDGNKEQRGNGIKIGWIFISSLVVILVFHTLFQK